MNHKDIAPVQIGRDEEQAGRKAGCVDRETWELHECDDLNGK